MTIEVARLDRHLAFLSSEISGLRKRPEPWAARKADQWEALRQDLQRVRQDQQMTGVGGKRLSDT
jgi:hypothetical protein